MDCQTLRPKLNPYLDGELNAVERKNIRDHLDNCPDCSLYYEELKEIENDLSELLNPPSNSTGSFTSELLEDAAKHFDEDSVTEADRTSSANVYEPGSGIIVTLATLIFGLAAGTYMGVGFVNALQQPTQPIEIRQSATRTQNPGAGSETATAVSFTDAYFELADAGRPGADQ